MLDLAFLPVLAAKLAVQLYRRPKPQNVMFLGLIALVWAGNLLVHLDWTGLWPGAETAGLRLGLLTISAMIAVIGGRVVPAFTRNAMLRAGHEEGLPESRATFDRVGIASAILLAVVAGAGISGPLTAAVAFVAGLAQAARLA